MSDLPLYGSAAAIKIVFVMREKFVCEGTGEGTDQAPPECITQKSSKRHLHAAFYYGVNKS